MLFSFKKTKNLPLGIANNNPGNIKFKKWVFWKGQIGKGRSKRFINFNSPQLGIRALVRVLGTYKIHKGISTIKDAISRWAPPSENNTEAYIASIESQTGIVRDQQIDLQDPEILQKLIPAIIQHENGVQPYSPDIIKAGILLGINR